MIKLRGTLRVAATAALLGLTLAGCGSKDDAEAAKPTDPKALLAASTSGLTAGDYAFTTTTPSGTGSGAFHLPSKSASLTAETKDADGAGKLEVRYVEPDRWVKMTMDPAAFADSTKGVDLNDPAYAGLKDMIDSFSGKYWLHVDTSKLKGSSQQVDIDMANPDITGASTLLSNVVTVQGDASTLTGTLDATKVTDPKRSGLVDPDDLKAMGPAAAAVPFTAKLDDKGRLTDLTVDLPKSGDIPAGKWVINITGYGAQKAQDKVTEPVKEAPESFYSAVSG